jgi:hypothetical protein
MEYAFSSELKDGFVHVRVRGNSDVATTARYMEEMFRACQKLRCPYLLIEENLHGERLSMGDIYQLISARIDQLLPVIRFAAFVDVSNRPSIPNMEFAENVIVNRGITVTYFATVAEAEAWLQKQISASSES